MVKEDDRYQDYALKYGYDIRNTNSLDIQILGMMLMYRFNYKQAVSDYYSDNKEADRIMNMPRANLLELLKKNKEDSIRRDIDFKKRFED